MLRAILFSLLSVLLAFALVFSLPPGEEDSHTEPAPVAESAGAVGEAEPELAAESAHSGDEELIRVLCGGESREMSMGDYLLMALAGEMPASFEPEALKAQAVALRSYALYYQDRPKAAHPDSAVCLSSACCAAGQSPEAMEESWGARAEEYKARLLAAVEATDGEYLSFEDETVLAMFHSCSLGATEHSLELRSPLPYLVSVSSPETAETVNGLVSSVRIYKDEFIAAVVKDYPAAAFPTGLTVGAVSYTPSGRVDSIEINGTAVSAVSLRRLLGLRSTTFQMVIDGDEVVITVYGYGHGVGMSQHGANLMAKDGCGCREILCHYYSGVEIRQLSSAEEE